MKEIIIQLINSLVLTEEIPNSQQLLNLMHKQQEQLIKLLINNYRPVWEIEATHKRCFLYYGEESASDECQSIIDFANMAGIGLLESFRLHVEVSELAIDRTNS